MKKNLLLFAFSIILIGVNAQTIGTCSILKDINVGTSSSLPTFKTFFKNKVFFVASNGTAVNGSEVWLTDGTTAGTVMLKDINPGTANSAPNSFTPINDNTMIFSATTTTEGAEIWKTDGTAAGTVLVKDIQTGSTGSTPASFIAYKGKAYFRAIQNVATGSELWATDGTDAGTVMIKEIAPGAAGSTPVNMTLFKDKLYFTATDTSTVGNELWVTDGTTAGTKLLKDINPGKANASPSGLIVAGNYMFFRAVDSIGGSELWRTDGTDTGTVMVKDINPGRNASGALNASAPFTLVNYNGKLIFTASSDTLGTEMWISDGTAAGTRLVADICRTANTSSSVANAFVWKNKVYFRANNCINGSELWETDGTAANTKMVKDINATGDASVANLQAYGGKLYFNASDGVNGFELWETDGTAANTKMACDIRAGSAGGGPSLIDVYFGGLLFSAQFDSTGTTIATGTELGIYKTTAGVSTKEAATFALSLKPTVATDFLMLDVLSEKTAKANIQIFDLLGRSFLTKNSALTEGANFENIEVSNLPNGLYFLSLTVGDERQTLKFVKQ